MVYSEVDRRLKRLQLYNNILALVAIIAVAAFAGFSIVQSNRLHAQQDDLQTLTFNLCDALQRAGIILELNGENPCAR